MNPQDMLDYALGQLDGADRARVERWMAGDPAAAERMSRLESGLHRLLDDERDPEPPTDLARRTSLRLEAFVEREERPTIEFAPPARQALRWTDYAAAAAIFLLGLGTLAPAIQSSRVASQSVGCMNNLLRIGQGMLRYETTHQTLPTVGPDERGTARTGLQYVRMRDLDLLGPDDLDCPGNGPNARIGEVPDVQRLVGGMDARSAAAYLDRLDYAAPMGYFVPAADAPGRQWRAMRCPDTPSALIPLASDQPPCTSDGRAVEGNSPNHGGHGQYVGFSDMHVGHFPGRRVGADPDMFLNHFRHTAPGVEPGDHVLGAGNAVVSPVP